MKQNAITKLRTPNIIMDALGKSELGFFPEFYKRNRCSVNWTYAIALALWASGVAVLFYANAGQYVENVTYSISILFLLFISLMTWMDRYVRKAQNNQNIIRSYGFDPSEVTGLRQVSYLRFKKQLYSMGYLTGNKEDDSKLLLEYISWVKPAPGLPKSSVWIAGFSTFATLLVARDTSEIILTLIGLYCVISLFFGYIQMSEIMRRKKYTALEFLQSLRAENLISDPN